MDNIQLMILELVLIPVLMTFFGWRFMKKPPKSRSSFFAYKSDRAIKTDETWTFAHRYLGKLWFFFGIVTIIVTAAVMAWAVFQGGSTIEMTAGIVCLCHLIPLGLPFFPTERALKKCFDSYGNRIDYDNFVD